MDWVKAIAEILNNEDITISEKVHEIRHFVEGEMKKRRELQNASDLSETFPDYCANYSE